MTTEPLMDKQKLIGALASEYGLNCTALEFLPVGSDVRSFSYRCLLEDGKALYLKLRQVEPLQALRLPAAAFVLSRVEGAIRPLLNRKTRREWMEFEGFQAFLFPYITGVPGWNHRATPSQWRQIGRSLRSLHEVALPESLAAGLPREDYSSFWRERALTYLGVQRNPRPLDACAEEFLNLLEEKREVLRVLVGQTQTLAEALRREPLELVCCHGDLHSGNLLVSENGRVHLIDWDTLTLAPKEKDLMFLGAGIGGLLDEEDAEAQFEAAYSHHRIHPEALCYFRRERIIEDFVAYCEQLLDTSEGGADREVMLTHWQRQFEPGSVFSRLDSGVSPP